MKSETGEVQWTAQLDAMLGKRTDAELAKLIGCTGETVRRRREYKGIAARRVKVAWTESRLRILAEYPDNVTAAAKLDLTVNAVKIARSRFKVQARPAEPSAAAPSATPAVRPPPARPPAPAAQAPPAVPPPAQAAKAASGIRAIKNAYGNPNMDSRSAVNLAISHECPGGTALLELLELVHQMDRRWPSGSEEEGILIAINRRLLKIRDAMADAVLLKTRETP